MFAGINAVEDDRTQRRFPILAGSNCFHTAIFISDPYIHTEGGPVAPGWFMKEPYGGRLMIVPAIPQQHANGVFAVLQFTGNIMREVQGAPVEPRIDGIEAMIADLVSIDV